MNDYSAFHNAEVRSIYLLGKQIALETFGKNATVNGLPVTRAKVESRIETLVFEANLAPIPPALSVQAGLPAEQLNDKPTPSMRVSMTLQIVPINTLLAVWIPHECLGQVHDSYEGGIQRFAFFLNENGVTTN